MNWIEIDKFLNGLIHAAKSAEQLYKHAMKKFNWSRKQAEDAIIPLQGRANLTHPVDVKKPQKKVKKSSKKS